MKKIILTLLVILISTGCSNNKYENITYTELIKKIENKDTFIVLFNDKSNDANQLKETLNNVLNENKLNAYLINSKSISLEQKNDLRKYLSFENLSIVFIKEGFDSSKLSHITDAETSKKVIENHLNNLGFIKK